MSAVTRMRVSPQGRGFSGIRTDISGFFFDIGGDPIENRLYLQKLSNNLITGLMKILKISIALICMSVLPGCGFITTMMTHENTALTNVELSRKNFVVVGQVEGVASSTYVLGFGGLSKQLYTKAKNEMIRKANMRGKARAIVDVTYEKHVAYYVFVAVHKVTAVGTVVEFKK
jgi:hypothetical protein